MSKVLEGRMPAQAGLRVLSDLLRLHQAVLSRARSLCPRAVVVVLVGRCVPGLRSEVEYELGCISAAVDNASHWGSYRGRLLSGVIFPEVRDITEYLLKPSCSSDIA